MRTLSHIVVIVGILLSLALPAAAWDIPEQQASIVVIHEPYSPYTQLPSFWNVAPTSLTAAVAIENTGTEGLEHWFVTMTARHNGEQVADTVKALPILFPHERDTLQLSVDYKPAQTMSTGYDFHVVVDNGAGEVTADSTIPAPALTELTYHTMSRDNGVPTGTFSVSSWLGQGLSRASVGITFSVPVKTTVNHVTFAINSTQSDCGSTQATIYRVNALDDVEAVANSSVVRFTSGLTEIMSYKATFEDVVLDPGLYAVAFIEPADMHLGLVTTSNYNGQGAFYSGDAENWAYMPLATPMVRLDVSNPLTQRGDVNDDGSIDAIDVNALIDIVLGKDPVIPINGNPDINGDDVVNGADINAIIDIILWKNH